MYWEEGVACIAGEPVMLGVSRFRKHQGHCIRASCWMAFVVSCPKFHLKCAQAASVVTHVAVTHVSLLCI